MDVHPPAYFALLHGWLAIAGSSPFALRYLSVIFSLLAVALLWRFARLVDPTPPTAPLAALMAAISPLYVAYGQEVRSYALVTCLALASTFIQWRLLWPGHRRNTAQKQAGLLVAYIILTAAALYSHYFTIFLLLFQNLLWLFWLWRGKSVLHPGVRPLKMDAGLWLVSQIGIVVLFAPQLALALRQVTSYTNPNLTPPGLLHFITQSWQAYTVGLTIEPLLAKWGMGGVAAVLGASWLLALTRQKAGRLPVNLKAMILLTWFVLPLAAYYLVLQRQPSFEPRYMMLVSPALFLLLALGVSRLALARLAIFRAGRYIFSLLLVAIFAVALYHYYTNPAYFKDDSAGVARWLAAQTTPDDVIYVDVPHPFHYYAGQIPAPTRYLFVDIHTAAGTLNRQAAGAGRLFWVTWWGSDTDPRGVIPFLAEKAGNSAGVREFKGYRVEWFELPTNPPPRFRLPADLPPLDAVFGDVLRLDGAAFGHAPQAETFANEPVWATLHFTLLRSTGVDYKVSLRLRNSQGQVVAQTDKELLNDRHFRTSAWPVADPALNQAINVYLLPLPPKTPPGQYQLETVVYNAQPPYPSEGVTQQASSDGVSAILGQLTISP